MPPDALVQPNTPQAPAPLPPADDPVDVTLLSFARDLGEVQGKVNELDKTVRHNCQRNEENFAKLDDKFDTLNSTIINSIGVTQGRIDANQDQITTLSNRTHELALALTKRSMALWAILIAMILSFIGGSLVKWSDVEKYFDRTTASERAEIVKQAVETASKLK